MNLEKVLSGVNILIQEDIKKNFKDINISDIYYDSRKVERNGIFVAIKGESVDGHDFVLPAYEKGCRVFLLECDLDLAEDAIKILVPNARVALSKISANFFNNPSKALKVIGITGTKGKTSVAAYIRHILLFSGISTGIIGTTGIRYNDYFSPAINTTPESYIIQKTMREMLDKGISHLVMEVSSGGIKMHRTDDVDFDIGIFTNLSPDHIGPTEHPDFEDYIACKARLFTQCKYGIFNFDDEYIKYMLKNATCEISSFSVKNPSDFMGINIENKRKDTNLGVEYDHLNGGAFVTRVYMPVPGEFNVYNSLAAIAACQYLRIDMKNIFTALSTIRLDGRTEILEVLDGITVVLDYAHNGLSLENILRTMKEYKHNRLIVLFGSVGGRTFLRRKELGDVAAKYADICVLTSDDPDWEDPMNIIEDIEKSFIGSKVKLFKIVDRSEAIYKAMELARRGDIIVISGKGHEKRMIIKGEKIFYDERGEIINAAKKIKDKL